MKLTPRNSWRLLLAFLFAALVQSSGFGQSAPDQTLNLLTNGDFKKGLNGWAIVSFGKQGQVTVVQPEEVLVDGLRPQPLGHAAPDPTEIHDGKPSVKIENISFDDTLIKQKVTVKPATRYRLSGWVKTKNIDPQLPKGGRVPSRWKPPGASFGIMGGFEKTESVGGTKGWTHLTFDFSSGTRSEIEVGPRIGHYASPVKGAAWFSDISLVEIGAPR